MIGHKHSIRSAGAAIAAVLAFNATSLFAQIGEPSTAAPTSQMADVPAIAVPMLTAPASSSPVFAPSQPVVQQVPSVEERRAAAVAASQAEASAMPPAAAHLFRNALVGSSEAIARGAAKQSREPAQAASRAIAPAEMKEATSVAQVPAVNPRLDDLAVKAAPAAAATTARTDQALIWALGGGALLMLGIAGTAIVRRRRHKEELDFFEHELARSRSVTAASANPPIVPAAEAVNPLKDAPVVSAIAPMSHKSATIEEMVAAAPDARNPFRTHAKRLRRARFLMAQRQVTKPVRAAQTTHAEPISQHATDRDQTVYRFDSQARRPGLLKPRLS